MESKNITLERAHRTGSKINGQKRAIIVKFLNNKEKQLQKEKFYVNQNYAERTVELRKELFKQAKGIRKSGKPACGINDQQRHISLV